jgi:hypothetical protein
VDALLAPDIELDILPQLTESELTAAGLPVGGRKRLLQVIEGQRNLSDAAMRATGSPAIVPTTEPAAEAEQRQPTVFFCDVVGSTYLRQYESLAPVPASNPESRDSNLFARATIAFKM